MLGIGTMLAGMGVSFIKDLIMDNGEDLVKEGIKKVTGIDLTKSKPTAEDVAKIQAAEAQILALDFEKLKFDLEVTKEANRHDEANRGQAHKTYQSKSDKTDQIAEQVIKRNLPLIGILVLVNVAIVYYMADNAPLIAIASQVIGIAIGNLFAERQAIINFFFGSSMGSKQKTAHINKMKDI